MPGKFCLLIFNVYLPQPRMETVMVVEDARRRTKAVGQNRTFCGTILILQ
jgi:hypothetical protein